MSEVVDIQRGEAPLLLSIPHAGTGIPEDVEAQLISPWLANKDADWWVHRLYDFALNLGATVVRARLSRTVIDVNRDPSGVSLYPGQATTGLVPVETFDGEAWRSRGRFTDAGEELGTAPPESNPRPLVQDYEITQLGGLWLPAALGF